MLFSIHVEAYVILADRYISEMREYFCTNFYSFILQKNIRRYA